MHLILHDASGLGTGNVLNILSISLNFNGEENMKCQYSTHPKHSKMVGDWNKA